VRLSFVKTPSWAAIRSALATRQVLLLAGLSFSLFWVYLPTVRELFYQWSTDSQYSHGYLVPAFALFLLWLRKEPWAKVVPGVYPWGLLLIFVGGLLRFVAGYIYFDWLDAFSLLPCLAGLAVFLGGRQALQWSWPAIAFLVFMIPLPFQLKMALGLPLQRIATIGSSYTLVTLGLPALAEGNTILLNDVQLGIVEACNGLSMLMIFFALTVAVAILIERPLWEKSLIVLSTVPIALVANVIRISVTGILHQTVSHSLADLVFHDLAGWLMMPLGLGLLWIELKLLSRILIPTPAKPGLLPVVKVPETKPAIGKPQKRLEKAEKKLAIPRPM
jgi:exosortase